MANLGETKPMNQLIIEMGGNEYVFAGGGGGQPGPSTVGTEEIKDGAVEMQDLNQSVKDSMITKEDRVTTDELDNFNV